jgi:hypothetical protein
MKDSVAFATLIASGIVIQNYDPSHGRALAALALPDEKGSDLGREIDSMLPVYFCRLGKLGWEVAEQNTTIVKITVRGPQTIGKHQNCTDTASKARIASLLDTLHTIRLPKDPSPQLFLAACLFFAFTIGALQHSHKADTYFNRILILGLITGCAAAFQTTNVLMGLKSYLAWSAILALLLSALVHLAITLWQGPQRLDNAPECELRLHERNCDRKDTQEDASKATSEIDKTRDI